MSPSPTSSSPSRSFGQSSGSGGARMSRFHRRKRPVLRNSPPQDRCSSGRRPRRFHLRPHPTHLLRRFQGIELVAVAVTIAFRMLAQPHWYGPHSIAYSAGIVGSDAGVHVVADSVGIRIGCARAATDVDGIEGIALAVAPTGDSGIPSGQAVSDAAAGWVLSSESDSLGTKKPGSSGLLS